MKWWCKPTQGSGLQLVLQGPWSRTPRLSVLTADIWLCLYQRAKYCTFAIQWHTMTISSQYYRTTAPHCVPIPDSWCLNHLLFSWRRCLWTYPRQGNSQTPHEESGENVSFLHVEICSRNKLLLWLGLLFPQVTINYIILLSLLLYEHTSLLWFHSLSWSD